MKKRRKVLVALAMAVTMLTPTGISAAEYGQGKKSAPDSS